jgi:hypothetical protein
MFEAIAIFLVGFIPSFLSCVILRKVQTHMRPHTYIATARNLPTGRLYRSHPYLEAMDYHYVEGLGYMVGDITCQFNARSPYLRCTLNPSGPCQKCPHYESIELN